MNPLLHLLIITIAGFTGVMIITWAFAWKTQFFSLVDGVWATGIGIGSALIQYFCGQNPERSLLVGALALFWGLRLGFHLSVRLKAHYPVEDTRYQKLKSEWSNQLKSKTLLFFIFQGITQFIFSLPFIFAALDNSPFPQWNEIMAALLIVMGVLGESISDSQLSRFKSDALNRGKVCNVGLWKFSRHPNYFFEWVIWLGFGSLSLTAQNGWIALLAPALMLYLLLFVTGVPPSEEQAIQSRGDAYKDYQNRTSPFIPWFPKTIKKSS